MILPVDGFTACWPSGGAARNARLRTAFCSAVLICLAAWRRTSLRGPLRRYPTMRVFCVPYGGGGQHAFSLLQQACETSRSADAGIELVTVPLPGRDTMHQDPLFQDIEAASRHVANFVKRHASGAYCLLGASAGCSVALQATHLLEVDPTMRHHPPLHLFVLSRNAPILGLPAGSTPFFSMNDSELQKSIVSWGQTPAELVPSLLPRFRADFRVDEMFVASRPTTAVRCPVTAVFGSLDDLVTPEGMALWHRHCEGTGFRLQRFDGQGHFFFQKPECLPRLCSLLTAVDQCSLCIHYLIDQQCLRTPEQAAFQVGDNEVHSYRWLKEQTDALALDIMGEYGLSPELDICAIILPKSAEYVVACLAAMKAGCPAMPLENRHNPDGFLLKLQQDVQLLGKRLFFICEARNQEQLVRLGFPHLISQKSFTVRSSAVVCSASSWPPAAATANSSGAAAATVVVAATPASAGSTLSFIYRPMSSAFIVFSSGSTGLPKLITVLHCNHVLSYWKRRDLIPFSDESTDTEACNIFLLWECFRPLMWGVRMVIIPDEIFCDPSLLVPFLVRQACTRIQFTPSFLRTLLLASERFPAAAAVIPGMRVVTLCGEVVTWDLVSCLRRLCPSASVYNVYSISECSEIAVADLSHWDPVAQRAVSDDSLQQSLIASAGVPMNEVLMLLRPVEGHGDDPSVGELYIGGPHVGLGYIGSEEKNREKFVPDFESPSLGKLYRTGDLARVSPDGSYSILGRTDFVIRIRGYSVDASAVEAALLAFSRRIAYALVCGVPSPAAAPAAVAGSECILVAYLVSPSHYQLVVSADGQEDQAGDVSGDLDAGPLSLARLRLHLKGLLPDYCIPSQFIVLRDAFQCDPVSKKIDRKALPHPSKVPDLILTDPSDSQGLSLSGISGSLPTADAVALAATEEDTHGVHAEPLSLADPRPALPEIAAQVTRAAMAAWTAVLGTARFPRDQHFFDLGGSSLSAIRVVHMMREQMSAFEQEISVSDLVRAKSLTDFCQFLIRKIAATAALCSRTSSASDTDPLPEGRGNPATSVAVHRFAVVGMACRFPGASTLSQFWEAVENGLCPVDTWAPQNAGDTTETADNKQKGAAIRPGVSLESDKAFDYAAFGLSRDEAVTMDPQHRLFLEVSVEALQDCLSMGWGAAARSCGSADACRRHDVGVVAACAMSTYPFATRMHMQGTSPLIDDPVGEFRLETGVDKDYLASRVAHCLDLHGPAMMVQTSCSSSVSALGIACSLLQEGRARAMICGASSVQFFADWFEGYVPREGMVHSTSGICSPFDRDASGTVFSDGVAALVLKRVEDAASDGDRIYAVVRGVGFSNDGARKRSFASSSVDGQIDSIRHALAQSGVTGRDIEYVEGHGSATLVGDPIELEAVRSALAPRNTRVLLGSVKGNFGHSNIAAGMAGLIRCALAIFHGRVPPTANFRSLNPACTTPDMFAVVSRPTLTEVATPPAAFPSARRMCLVCGLGIGGSNAHAVLCAHEPSGDGLQRGATAAVAPPSDFLPLYFYGASKEAVVSAIGQFSKSDLLSSWPSLAHAVSWRLQHGFRPPGGRAERFRSVVSASPSVSSHHLRWLLDDAKLHVTEREPVLPAPLQGLGTESSQRRRFIVLFPGQGSLAASIDVRQLMQDCPHFRAALMACSDALSSLPAQPGEDGSWRCGAGFDVAEFLCRCSPRDMEDDDDLCYRLPCALFALYYSLFAEWKARANLCDASDSVSFLGHSLGYLIALAGARVLSLPDAFAVLLARGRVPRRYLAAVGTGALYAVRVGGGRGRGVHIPTEFPSAFLAAENSAEEAVFGVAGSREAAFEGFLSSIPSAEFAFKRLAGVRIPFHTPLIADHVCRADLDPLQWRRLPLPANYRIYCNVTGTRLSKDSPLLLADHLVSPVQFRKMTETCLADLLLEADHGSISVVECGPQLLSRFVLAAASEDQRTQLTISTLLPSRTAKADGDIRACDIQSSLLMSAIAKSLADPILVPDDDFVRPLLETLPTSELDRLLRLSRPLVFDHSGDRSSLWHKNDDVDRGSVTGNSSSVSAPRRIAAVAVSDVVVRLAAPPADGRAAPAAAVVVIASSLRNLEGAAAPALPEGLATAGCLVLDQFAALDELPLLAPLLSSHPNVSSVVFLDPQVALQPAVFVQEIATLHRCLCVEGLTSADAAAKRRLVQALLGDPKIPVAAILQVLEGRRQMFPREVRIRSRFLTPFSKPVLSASAAAAGSAVFGRPDAAMLVIGGLGKIGNAIVSRYASSKSILVTSRGAQRAVDPLFLHDRVSIVWDFDPSRMECWDALLQKHQTVETVIHLGGVAHLQWLSEISTGDVAAEFAAKVSPVSCLLKVLGTARPSAFPLRQLICFSSASTVFGGFGMGAYAAANLEMDRALAHGAELFCEKGVRVVSLLWDDWNFSYESDDSAARQQISSHPVIVDRVAAHAMDPSEALDMLESLLSAPGDWFGDLLVSARTVAELEDMFLLWTNAARRSEAAEEVGRCDCAVATGAAENNSRATAFSRVLVAVHQVLGLQTWPRADDNFFALGGDSLSSLRLVSKLRRHVPSVTVQQVFAAKSLQDLLPP